MKTIKVVVDGGKYKWVELPREEALKLLEIIEGKLGKSPRDLQETMRYLRHFEEFYRDMQKRFKDFIAPPHSLDDMIRGIVVVDKIALKKEGNEEIATIVFDRRISVDLLKEALKELGYEVEVEVEKPW
ncbi:hypothetical protein [Ignicoccus hospitalis]|uniref:Uncharacterized protein n=1 Tax=Ignicoccus hospitalis (strain KIN4/I / DSM 18386 / JCM 14125) TaxID=453591 RepID=A8AAE4_IGNH4|nr:hypothetical protein [Ignicoccus hospitalis]ABU81896.1 hypothetical protein Igni_0714 [Ignicoccus hospitalis KIN4/I]HIH89946.1 hypothetical protein [Desulfurococcaceae archaeon]